MKVLLEFVSQNMPEADANKLIDFIKENLKLIKYIWEDLKNILNNWITVINNFEIDKKI